MLKPKYHSLEAKAEVVEFIHEMHNRANNIYRSLLERSDSDLQSAVYDNLDYIDKRYAEITIGDTYVVSSCYIHDQYKALISTDIEDNRYYEVTYDEPACRYYVDEYVKRVRMFDSEKEKKRFEFYRDGIC